MRQWVAIVSEEQFITERLYARERVTVPAGAGAGEVEAGDAVALVAATAPAVLFGHGIVRGRDASGDASGVYSGVDSGVEACVEVEYRARVYDDPPPVPADVLPTVMTPGLHPLPAAQFTRLATLVTATAEAGAGRSVWFVSVAVPIEAASPAEAVREYWTYIEKLGPRELPAYVWPLGDELAMQAFVLGAVTNLDPEEDDDD